MKKAEKTRGQKSKKTGRPSKYKKEYEEQVYKLCLLGAIDDEIADFFGVDVATINRWKLAHKEFRESLKKGKMIADSNIADSLYQRAKGYSHEDVHISNYQGDITVTKITKHYPPDTTAGIFWLKNRQPKKWRDKQEIKNEHNFNIISESLQEVLDESGIPQPKE